MASSVVIPGPVAAANAWHGANSAVTEAAEGLGQLSEVMTEYTAEPTIPAAAVTAIAARYSILMAMASIAPGQIINSIRRRFRVRVVAAPIA